ncbi:MAG: ferrous iron transport protein A [Microcoleaceae cyanobacterium]
MSDSLSAPQPWKVTFIGGNAELDDCPAFSEEIISQISSKNCLLLSTAAVGDRVRIIEIVGNARIAYHLQYVGIVRGLEITVVSCTSSGSVIVTFQGHQIGLGAQIAKRVIVEQDIHRIIDQNFMCLN